MSHRTSTSTDAFRKHLKQREIIDVIGALVERSFAGASMPVTFRNNESGLADEQSKSRMRLFVPDLARALSIRRLIAPVRLDSSSLAEFVGRLSFPVFFVDANLRLITQTKGPCVQEKYCGKKRALSP